MDDDAKSPEPEVVTHPCAIRRGRPALAAVRESLEHEPMPEPDPERQGRFIYRCRNCHQIIE